MEGSDAQTGAANSGRHRAPDGDAQTAYIPRITDASEDGVPGGPLDPPASLGGTTPWPSFSGPAAQTSPAEPAPRVPSVAAPSSAPVAAADTAVIRTGAS